MGLSEEPDVWTMGGNSSWQHIAKEGRVGFSVDQTKEWLGQMWATCERDSLHYYFTSHNSYKILKFSRECSIQIIYIFLNWLKYTL